MDKKDWLKIMQALGLLTQVGFIIVLCAGAGFLLGYLLDNLAGTNYLFKIPGVLLGIAAGFLTVYRLIKGIILDNNDHEREK
ncbi:MAG: AtpZ/AtpI family protein [Bacillota bacterium]